MKKTLSLVLILAMLISSVTFVPAAFAAEETTTEETVTAEPAETKADPEPATDDMNALAALGVLDDSQLADSAAYVTRGEFAKIAVRFAASPLPSSAPNYRDLDGDSALYASAAVTYGLMDDGVTGDFRSTKNITGVDVIKAVVVSLGYTDVAKYFGSYNMAATKIGVCKKLKLRSDITYAELANALVDALGVESVYTYSNAGSVNVEKTGVSYIEDTFDCRIMRGRITANEQTSISGAAGLGKGYAEIAGERFRTNVDMNRYLGSTVECIVEGTGTQQTIIYVFRDRMSGKESVEFDAKDISEFKNYVYTYFDSDSKRKTVSVERDCIVIINSQLTAAYNTSDLLPQNGTVRLVDGNGDGKYDIIYVDSYFVKTATKPDIANKTIADKFGDGTVKWTDTTILDVTKDGKDIDISALKKGDILMVYQSKDGEYLRIDAASKTVKGIVNSFKTGNDVLVVGGEKYNVDIDYFRAHTDKFTYTENGKTVDNNVFSGKRVTAYLTAAGKIAYMEYGSSGYEVGYLVDAAETNVKSLNPTLAFSIFTSAGKLETFEAAGDKITVDNERVDHEKTLEMLRKGGSEVLSQVVQYALNDDGKLTAIDTPYNNQPQVVSGTEFANRHAGSKETDSSFRITYSSYLNSSTPDALLCKNSTGVSFGRDVKVILGSSYTIFTVPATPKGAAEASFGVYNTAGEYYKSDRFYKLEAYQFDDSSFAADVLLTIDEAGRGDGNVTQQNVRTITDIQTIAGETAGDAKQLSVTGNSYTSGTIYATEEKYWKYVPVSDPDDNNTYELGIGDIIWYDINNNNEIVTIFLVYDASESDPDKAFKASSRADMRRRHGDIYTYPRMVFYDVYEVKGKTAKVTTSNLHTFDGDLKSLDYDMENLDIFGDGLVHIDKTGRDIKIDANGNYQGAVSLDNIKDYVSYGKECSRIISVTKWGYAEILFIINDTSDVR